MWFVVDCQERIKTDREAFESEVKSILANWWRQKSSEAARLYGEWVTAQKKRKAEPSSSQDQAKRQKTDAAGEMATTATGAEAADTPAFDA